MDIICKVLFSDGRLRYKADTFWTCIEDREYAKSHSLESLQTNLITNLLSHCNRNLSDTQNFWGGAKIGFDWIIKEENYHILETSPGYWIYQLKYDPEKDEMILIDISRKAKLEKLSKVN